MSLFSSFCPSPAPSLLLLSSFTHAGGGAQYELGPDQVFILLTGLPPRVWGGHTLDLCKSIGDFIMKDIIERHLKWIGRKQEEKFNLIGIHPHHGWGNKLLKAILCIERIKHKMIYIFILYLAVDGNYQTQEWGSAWVSTHKCKMSMFTPILGVAHQTQHLPSRKPIFNSKNIIEYYLSIWSWHGGTETLRENKCVLFAWGSKDGSLTAQSDALTRCQWRRTWSLYLSSDNIPQHASVPPQTWWVSPW